MSNKQVSSHTGIRLPNDLRKQADKIAKRYGSLTVVLTEAIRLGLEIIQKADIHKTKLVLISVEELKSK
jgi:hypothetical protein